MHSPAKHIVTKTSEQAVLVLSFAGFQRTTSSIQFRVFLRKAHDRRSEPVRILHPKLGASLFSCDTNRHLCVGIGNHPSENALLHCLWTWAEDVPPRNCTIRQLTHPTLPQHCRRIARPFCCISEKQVIYGEAQRGSLSLFQRGESPNFNFTPNLSL